MDYHDLFDDLEDLADDTFSSFGPCNNSTNHNNVNPSSYHQEFLDPKYLSSSFVCSGAVHHHHHHQDHHPLVAENNDETIEDSSGGDEEEEEEDGDMDSNGRTDTGMVSQSYTTHDDGDDGIRVRHVDLLDYNGMLLVEDQQRIRSPRLKMQPQYFGLEFFDSVNGHSVVPFLSSDIVVAMRQTDRIALYFKFRRYLCCRAAVPNDGNGATKAQERFMMDYDEEDDDDGGERGEMANDVEYFSDSPVSRMMSMLVYFNSNSDITQVFDYMQRSQFIMSHLRLVYPGWMFCSVSCTKNDVELFVLECEDPVVYRDSSSARNRRLRTMVNVNRSIVTVKTQMEGVSSNSVQKTKSSETRPEATTIDKQEMATADRNLQTVHPFGTTNSDAATSTTTTVATKNIAILDNDKLAEVLPFNFKTLHRALQTFALQLMEQGRLMPFQMTSGLCAALEVATTRPAIRRAMQLLQTLSKYPNTQLTQLDKVGKWLLETSNGAANEEETKRAVTRTMHLPLQDRSGANKKMQMTGDVVDGDWVVIGANWLDDKSASQPTAEQRQAPNNQQQAHDEKDATTQQPAKHKPLIRRRFKHKPSCPFM